MKYVPTYDFWNCPVVVVLGQDGLLANTAKYVGDLPIVGVNPDPQRFDGVLLPFQVNEARRAVSRVLDKRSQFRAVTLAEALLNDGQRLLAFNDFFVGSRTHVSARYTIEVGQQREPHSSSGVLVSTGAGSTGWMSSVFNMTSGVARLLGSEVTGAVRLEWDARRLIWAVREPFQSKHSQAQLVAGVLDEGQELVIESLMPSDGVIFSDGIESDFLQFTSGTIARIGVAKQKARVGHPVISGYNALMVSSKTVQELNRELADKLAEEGRNDPKSPYAGKFVGIANGQVVVVADDLNEMVSRLRQVEPDRTKTFGVEVGHDYSVVEEVWTVS